MSPAAQGKIDAYRFGRLAERACGWRLRLTGYRIVCRGYRAAGGEIDIIARRGGTIAFIEVKARRKPADAIQALGRGQRRRIERAALAFLARHPEFSSLDARFDLMIVTRRRWPRHLAGAWTLDT